MRRERILTPEKYDRLIGMPVTRKIRAAEDEAILRIFRERVKPEDSILEIGSGTGYYTIRFAKASKRLTAVDSNPRMVEHLKKEVEEKGIDNVEIVGGDFLTYGNGEKHDWVIALGVLEYVEDPGEFLERLMSYSNKWVLITFPSPNVIGWLYWITSRFNGVHIHLFTKRTIEEKYGKSIVHLEDVGLKSKVMPGMTLVCLIERENVQPS
jgi:SAM-dependent methyltransferase